MALKATRCLHDVEGTLSVSEHAHFSEKMLDCDEDHRGKVLGHLQAGEVYVSCRRSRTSFLWALLELFGFGHSKTKARVWKQLWRSVVAAFRSRGGLQEFAAAFLLTVTSCDGSIWAKRVSLGGFSTGGSDSRINFYVDSSLVPLIMGMVKAAVPTMSGALLAMATVRDVRNVVHVIFNRASVRKSLAVALHAAARTAPTAPDRRLALHHLPCDSFRHEIISFVMHIYADDLAQFNLNVNKHADDLDLA
jgi:hypothetical protein